MKNNINDNNCYNLVMSQNIIFSLMIICKGDRKTAYGYKWKWKEEDVRNS